MSIGYRAPTGMWATQEWSDPAPDKTWWGRARKNAGKQWDDQRPDAKDWRQFQAVVARELDDQVRYRNKTALASGDFPFSKGGFAAMWDLELSQAHYRESGKFFPVFLLKYRDGTAPFLLFTDRDYLGLGG